MELASPPLLEFVPALGGGVALGLWEAAALILLAVAFLLSKVPLPLFQQAANALGSKAHDMQSWAGDRVNQMVGVWNRIADQGYAAQHNYSAQLVNGAQAEVNALANVQHGIIPHRTRTLADREDTLHADSISYSQGLHHQSETHLAQSAAAETAYTRATGQAAASFAQELDQSERALSQQLHAEAVRFTQAVGAADQAQAQALYKAAVAFTQQALQSAQDYAAKVGADAQAYTDATAKSLEGYVETVGANAATDARTVVGAAVGPLIAAQAVTSEAVNALRNSDCMRFCNVLGGIGSLLQGLELAGLLALLAEAYSNPGGAAGVIRDDLERPAEDALSSVLGLFGVKVA